ncbi:bleomycin hydrolase [Eubacterium ruminantium]|uniref:Aminopeptidase n=1 Tax=Eubacterium ruminantium TaxID=42322 RepID=A0A1T4MZ39_9FIRM|nr:C1 family peptidase [Eubacterium ruminantium]SCW51160.1 bleomycin hydrolase [Eubacterium ruminantium]SDM68678.1 bleomycin hydrolase [Eubacterium ruminantium]SJZ72262.1 aminopeptidase C. Cysteine peptidase. MEROPS family C01B [Eubacterium ruminantium]
MPNSISIENLDGFSEDFNKDRANIIAANATMKNGILEAATDYKGVRNIPNSFSVDLKTGKITNQKSSGRCWIFSALNTFRFEIMKKYKLDNFELSQNYIFFYDKLEKANYFLESVLKTVDEPVDGRLYSFLNAGPLADGGQWDMFANLVRKYGVVPKEVYPDAASATNSRWMDEMVTSKLREFAITLRNKALSGEAETALQKEKTAMLNDIYRMLVISLGEPPKTFDMTLRDKDDKVYQENGITPKEFYDKYVGINLDNLVSLVNAPAENKPMNKMYTVKFLGNVVEGEPVHYLNLPIDKLKEAVINQLKDGHPVWFGSDCIKFSGRKDGVFDRDSVKAEQLFNIEYAFTKGDRLMYGDSAMNHAMVILGVNINNEGKADRWRIENSWGKDAGLDGYYIASDSWFDEFVYQVVVDKKYLDKETLGLLDQPLIELEPWDPLGSLAD